jgi:hypothetical protein
VGQVLWTERSGTERLVSAAADGRVTEWSMKKGLNPSGMRLYCSLSLFLSLSVSPLPVMLTPPSDLMMLRRTPNPARLGDARIDPFITRHAAGLCVAFWPRDPNMFAFSFDCSSFCFFLFSIVFCGLFFMDAAMWSALIRVFCSNAPLRTRNNTSTRLWVTVDPSAISSACCSSFPHSPWDRSWRCQVFAIPAGSSAQLQCGLDSAAVAC